MWLLNVAREVLRCAGRSVLPEKILQSDEMALDLANRQALADSDPNNVWALKVHHLLPANLPRSRIITSIRDPRDVLVSFRRFMNTTFDDALVACEDVVTYAETYRSYPPEVLLKIDYADIEERPVRVTSQVAGFLGVPLDATDNARIVETLSREKVKTRIEEATAMVLESVRQNLPVPRASVVTDGDRIIRFFDPTTGFQSGHVSEHRSGSWRVQLADTEKQAVMDRLGDWLTRNGFPPE